MLAAAQEGGELSTDYTPRQLASFVEGLLFRAVLEWGAGFSKAPSLADAMVLAFDFFVRGAQPRAVE